MVVSSWKARRCAAFATTTTTTTRSIGFAILICRPQNRLSPRDDDDDDDSDDRLNVEKRNDAFLRRGERG